MIKDSGERIVMDNVTLLQGDCLERMKEIPDSSIDMILCDPPYGTTHCDWDKALNLPELWREYKRIIKGNGAILLFCMQPFETDVINSNRGMFRYEIVWHKTQPTGFLNANKMPLRIHENVVVFYKHLPTYNPQMQVVTGVPIGQKKKLGSYQAQQYNRYIAGIKEWVETGRRMPTDVIKFSNWNGALFGKTDKATKHPTQKPLDLLEYLILTYTNEGDVVLDNCMGSGSTGVACVNTNRRFIGIELTNHYFEVASERIQEAQTKDKQLSLFEVSE